MSRFTVLFYEDLNGNKPVEKFLLQLDKKMRAKVLGLLEILQENGYQLREPYSKHLEDGIFELRGKFGSDISRVLYFFYNNGEIILTNGFIKKTNKTPRNEIETAKKRRMDFGNRRGKSENVK
ncbi:MAG: type II toxin-antitoxin system RelE/ParE family toxin [Lachnospiraceae bacterium]|nr:type II toxin-antitoxin system RelE/ParE family toxin [Lachnospiraceae bacterium]